MTEAIQIKIMEYEIKEIKNDEINRNHPDSKKKIKTTTTTKSDHPQSINFCFEVHTRKVALSLIIIDLTINLLLRSSIQFFSQDFLKSFHTEGVLSCFH